MKLRNFTLIFLFILFSNTVLAQNKGFIFGVSGAVGPSYMFKQNTYYLLTNNKELDYKFHVGYNGRAFFGYNINNDHGVLLEFAYMKEGQRYKDLFRGKPLEGTHEKAVDFNLFGGAVVYKFTPLLPGQKTNRTPDQIKARLNVQVGFEVDYLIKAKMDYKIDGNNLNAFKIGDTTYVFGYPPGTVTLVSNGASLQYPLSYYGPPATNDYRSFFIKTQFSLLLRAGVDINLNKKKTLLLNTGIETKIGLNDINAKEYRKHPSYHSSRNMLFALRVGLSYIIQKKEAENKTDKKKTTKPAKVKTPGGDKNKRVDKVDKATRKRLGK